MSDDVVLYFAPFSRAVISLWMLEELGIPYRRELVDIRADAQKAPEYLKLNPMGKVPALAVNGTIITENPAICLYLADRYGYGTLSPKIEDADRGSFLRWMTFSTAVLEPAMIVHSANLAEQIGLAGWGAYDDVIKTLVGALEGKTWLLGDRFSAADVVMGGEVAWGLLAKYLPEDPVLVAYSQRVGERPANQKAWTIT